MKNQTRTILKFAILGLGLAFALSSCARRAAVRIDVGHPAAARVVVGQKGHVHTLRCGHYKYRGKWYFVKGHVHGPKCGHRFAGGVWVYKK